MTDFYTSCIFITFLNFIVALRVDAIACFYCQSLVHDNPDTRPEYEDKYSSSGGYYRILYVSGEGIGCFSCKSINHDNPECEDKFNNTGGFYKQNCWASRTGRIGKFPGTQCIKMIAEDENTGYSMIVRDCVVDNGGTNSETEIGRTGHCGWMKVIKFNDRRMRGCVVTCDTDGCNGAVTNYSAPTILHLLFVLLLYRIGVSLS